MPRGVYAAPTRLNQLPGRCVFTYGWLLVLQEVPELRLEAGSAVPLHVPDCCPQAMEGQGRVLLVPGLVRRLAARVRFRRRWRAHAAYASAAVALLLGGAVGSVSYRIHVENGRESATGLPFHPRPDAASRLMVVAPHCDDETLGCGGVLRMAARAGSAVRVVFVTNGDGFQLAVRRAYHLVRPKPADYLRFAAQRRREVKAALARLGLDPSDAIFLGYPDRGIAHLWLTHWSEENAYTSPYTRVAASPYADSYRRDAPYCGAALLQDLEQIILEFGPTAIYIPHPNDDHPDHWATSSFARAAIERLGLESSVDVYTYLVHRGDWPVPQGLHRTRALAPPAALARLDTRWTAFPLDAEALDAKAHALAVYRSQMPLLRRFLLSFVRRTELFGVLPPSSAHSAPLGGIQVDGDASEWRAIAPTILEPSDDTLPAGLDGGSDLVSIRACQDSRHLYLLLSSRDQLSSQLTYVLYVRAIDSSARTVTITAGPRSISAAPGVQVARGGRSVEASISLQLLGGARVVYVGAVARARRFTVDRTGWRALHLAPPQAVAAGR